MMKGDSMLNSLCRNVFLTCAAASAAVAGAQSTVTLRFTVWDGDVAQVALREEVKRFEAAHPNIKVKFEAADYQGYFDKLLTQYAANVAPDVVMMNPEFFQRFSRRGAFLPLNPFFDDVPGFDIKEYYPSIVKAHSLGDTVYVLPRDIAPIAIVYYNKRLFKEAGIPFPDGTWTWDWEPRPQLREKCFTWVIQQLSKKNAAGKPTQWGYVPGWPGLFIDQTYLSLGARVADDYENPTKLLYDDPRIARAFDWYADLALRKRWIPSNFDQVGTSSRQLFTQQRVAMYQSGIWDTPELRKEIQPVDQGGFEWDIALAPASKDGTRAYPTGGSGYAIMSKTKHPAESWLLAKWMAGPPGMLAMARTGIAQPAIRKLALQEPWIPGPNTPAAQQIPRNRIITDLAEPHVVFAPTGLFWPEVNGIAQQPWGQVFNGDEDARTALPRGNAVAQKRLDTLRQEQNLPPFNWPLATAIGLAIAGAIVGWIYWPERKIRRTSKEKRENRIAYLFILPWVVGTVVFTTGPMILSLLMSFADWDVIRDARWRALGNYYEAFAVDPTFWTSVRVTIVFTLVSVPLGLIAALSLAMLLNTKVKGMPLWRTCYYIPSIASAVALSLIWIRIFQPEGGLLNATIFGIDGRGGIPLLQTLMAPLTGANGQINWLQNDRTALGSLILMGIFGAGGGMVILLAALQGVPNFYYEAATLDGASPWRRFLKVTVPMISPALFFSLITGFIGSFQYFTQAFVMTQGGPNNATMFLMIMIYNNAFATIRMGYSSALAWLLFFIVLVFTIVQLKGNKYVYYEGAK
jgi:multiple sugar transport system permease protein